MSPELSQALTVALYLFIGLNVFGLLFVIYMFISQVIATRKINNEIRKIRKIGGRL